MKERGELLSINHARIIGLWVGVVKALTMPCSERETVKVLLALPTVPSVARMYTSPGPDDDDWLPLLWPDATRGPWVLRIRFASVGARRECVGLQIRSFREEDENWPAAVPTEFNDEGYENDLPILTGSVLREIRLAEIVNDLRREVGRRLRAAARSPVTVPKAILLAAAREYESDRERADRSDLPRVAEVYLAAWEAGEPPTKAVARAFTISDSAAAKRVSRARAAGYLPETTQGRGGAHPPPKRKNRRKP